MRQETSEGACAKGSSARNRVSGALIGALGSASEAPKARLVAIALAAEGIAEASRRHRGAREGPLAAIVA
jgi:hypothetical protein